MSLVFSENCSYKKSVGLLLFCLLMLLNIFFQSIQQMVLNAIRFLLSSQKANMATILINF